MMSFMEDFNHLRIQLKDIISATDNFAHNKLIGRGGFGSVYKGELSRPKGQIIVACKRLDRNFGQGNIEFSKEIMMLSRCKHKNLVSLLHFCIEGDERILVYEYASHGSLDRYLSDVSLTWRQRLKICIGVAHGLQYLHDPKDTQQRVIHRDIKSSNILLDEQWVAKVSDFGLSKLGPANQPQTYVFSNAVGTPGYCDPNYRETSFLSKESDVYSFGVVLFEVMCGTLCCEYHRDGGQYKDLVPMWKKCFEQDRLDDIICHGLKEHMDPSSLKTFSTIAYQCLKKAREERPTIAKIVQRLAVALKLQDLFEDMGKRMNFEGMKRIADLAASPLSYISQSHLLLLFMKGILVDDGKTWFQVNKKGEHCELISAEKCISKFGRLYIEPCTTPVSRFQFLFKHLSTPYWRLTVKTQFLSPHVTYVVNLVYDCGQGDAPNLRVPFKYKWDTMSQYSTSCVAYLGEDGWRRTELFQFTSTKNKHYFDIQFVKERNSHQYDQSTPSIEGIEFCPLDLETDKKLEDKNKVYNQLVTNSNIDWEKKLPRGYSEILEWSKDTYDSSMTKKEIYFFLRKGLHIKDPQEWFSAGEWFSISKNSKKRYMMPARRILQEEKLGWNNFLSRRVSWVWKSLQGSRFGEVAETCDKNHLAFCLQIKPQLLSPRTIYACYLVYKLPENASMFEDIVVTRFTRRSSTFTSRERYIYLLTPPHTPIIEQSTDDRPSRTCKIKGHPKLRKDGWMEIQVWEFKNTTFDYIKVDGYMKSLNKWNFTGLLLQGIEFRPAKVFFQSYIDISLYG